MAGVPVPVRCIGWLKVTALGDRAGSTFLYEPRAHGWLFSYYLLSSFFCIIRKAVPASFQRHCNSIGV